MKEAALALMKLGPSAVLVKGGHSVEDARDILYDGKEFHVFSGKRISTENTHGTGCTLSSAIAAGLAKDSRSRRLWEKQRNTWKGPLPRRQRIL